MGDVSNYTAPEYASDSSADLQVIMTGGSNWMARMTALAQAQEKAQAAIVKAGIAGDIVALREQARVDRDTAAKQAADARGFADGIVSKANEQADEILAKARVEADRIIAEGKANAAAAVDATKAAKDAADRALEKADQKLAEANATLDRAKSREAELSAASAAVKQQAADLTAAAAEAEEVKTRYLSRAEKLLAILSEDVK